MMHQDMPAPQHPSGDSTQLSEAQTSGTSDLSKCISAETLLQQAVYLQMIGPS